MSNTTACPSCGAAATLPEGLSGLLLRCPKCGLAFVAQAALPPLPARPVAPQLIHDSDADEPVSVVPAEEPARQSPRNISWDRCRSCGEMIPPQLSRCEYCGEARGRWFPPPRRDVEPHRAGLLQWFATVSSIFGAASCALVVPLVVAIPLGIVTWSLAARDLARMRRGLMDRTGMARTRTARDTAALGVLLGSATACGWLAILLYRVLANG